MHRATLAQIVSVATAAAAATVMITASAQAFGDAPKPTIDCRKKKNRSHPDCKNPQNPGGQHRVDAAYSAAYILAQRSEYAKARDILRAVEDSGDVRIYNYLGYTTRKLGDPEAALVYYLRALSMRPDYALARSYMGEAYVALGRLSDARSELTKIKSLCGKRCDAYRALEDAIEARRRG